ncbi:MAG TPA: TA system VapC family ribonuclease toxin [Phycisphaerales bacterium]|nr:TA system VapC family ribonuclease toxin [Phycisphaerales bacterium]
MIGIDTQLLVYAARGETDWHAVALRVLVDLAESGRPWAIPWPCVHEFISTVTRPRLFNPPNTPEQAFAAVTAWMESPSLVLLHEGSTHFARLRELAFAAKIVGARIHDARIAALCLENGVQEFWTADRDFSAFPSLRVRNPLVAYQ